MAFMLIFLIPIAVLVALLVVRDRQRRRRHGIDVDVDSRVRAVRRDVKGDTASKNNLFGSGGVGGGGGM